MLLFFLKDESIQNGPKVIMVLSDTLSDLDKLNYGKYQLCSSKIDMTYVYTLFFNDKLVPGWLRCCLSDLVKVNHGEYRKYTLYSSKIDVVPGWPSYRISTFAMSILGEHNLVDLYEVAEGVWEHLDPPETTLNQFVFDLSMWT